MAEQNAFCPAVTRSFSRPQPDTIRLWTIQPPHVWNALQKQGMLLVDPDHPEFTKGIDYYRGAYDWMRAQMARRIPGYTGNYPWWAYEHFLDLRFYRWNLSRPEEHLVRLKLAVPREQVLLSAYGAWHFVLSRWYLPEALDLEESEREADAWKKEAAQHGIDVRRIGPLSESWETQLQSSWERIYDVDRRRPAETIQATFERLELSQVVKVTEFSSMSAQRKD